MLKSRPNGSGYLTYRYNLKLKLYLALYPNELGYNAINLFLGEGHLTLKTRSSTASSVFSRYPMNFIRVINHNIKTAIITGPHPFSKRKADLIIKKLAHAKEKKSRFFDAGSSKARSSLPRKLQIA